MSEPGTDIKSSALELIGNTPLLALDRLHPGPGRLLAKCEFMNPGGSVKCRASLHMMNEAIKRGELKKGDSVVEITSGNQGCGLAVVCAVLGHPLTVYMSAGNSVQRALHMEALGANVVRVPQVYGTYGSVTHQDVDATKEACHRMLDSNKAFLVNQFGNENNPGAHYSTTGPEIWRQAGGRVDAFVSMVGTGGTFTGTARYLKEKNPKIQTVVVEPEGAEAIAGRDVIKPLHLLQGAGYGRIPALLDLDLVDGTFSVSDEEAVECRRLLGVKEGLYVGYSSAANVVGALKLLRSGRVDENAWIVTTLPDTGLKYTPVPDELTKTS